MFAHKTRVLDGLPRCSSLPKCRRYIREEKGMEDLGAIDALKRTSSRP